MTNELIAAIKTAFDGNSALNSMVKGLFYPWAPEDTELPLITVVPIGLPPDGYMKDAGIHYIENITIQFTVFVDEYEMDAGWSIMNALQSLYDNNLLGATLSNSAKILLVKRQSSGTVIEQPEGGWGIAVEYRYKVEET